MQEADSANTQSYPTIEYPDSIKKPIPSWAGLEKSSSLRRLSLSRGSRMDPGLLTESNQLPPATSLNVIFTFDLKAEADSLKKNCSQVVRYAKSIIAFFVAGGFNADVEEQNKICEEYFSGMGKSLLEVRFFSLECTLISF